MAFSESLAARIRDDLMRTRGIEEKRMFGGIGFLMNGNILVGVWKESLIVRLGPDAYADTLLEPHVREFDITGRPMTGWVLVDPDGLEEDESLRDWIRQATAFVRTLPAK
jgi:TfoX/Sxy family transcriptional regulator of competence genes